MVKKSINVLPSDVLLVSFDFTHGDQNRICIVGKKSSDHPDSPVDIVNFFSGDQAQKIFQLLAVPESKTEEAQESNE